MFDNLRYNFWREKKLNPSVLLFLYYGKIDFLKNVMGIVNLTHAPDNKCPTSWAGHGECTCYRFIWSYVHIMGMYIVYCIYTILYIYVATFYTDSNVNLLILCKGYE